MSRGNETSGEMADLIERFLSEQLRYPQEWSDFVDCGNRDPKLNSLVKQCEIISSQFEPAQKSLGLNRDKRWQDATNELRKIASQLRGFEKGS